MCRGNLRRQAENGAGVPNLLFAAILWITARLPRRFAPRNDGKKVKRGERTRKKQLYTTNSAIRLP